MGWIDRAHGLDLAHGLDFADLWFIVKAMSFLGHIARSVTVWR